MRENTGNHAEDIKKTIKHGETEITITKEAISVSAPNIILESGKLNHQS